MRISPLLFAIRSFIWRTPSYFNVCLVSVSCPLILSLIIFPFVLLLVITVLVLVVFSFILFYLDSKGAGWIFVRDSERSKIIAVERIIVPELSRYIFCDSLFKLSSVIGTTCVISIRTSIRNILHFYYCIIFKIVN